MRLGDDTRHDGQDGQRLTILTIMSNTVKRYKTQMMDNMAKMSIVFPAMID